MTCEYIGYEINKNAAGVMIAAENDVFIGL